MRIQQLFGVAASKGLPCRESAHIERVDLLHQWDLSELPGVHRGHFVYMRGANTDADERIPVLGWGVVP